MRKLRLTEVLVEIIVLHDVFIFNIKSHFLFVGKPKGKLLIFVHNAVWQHLLIIKCFSRYKKEKLGRNHKYDVRPTLALDEQPYHSHRN